MKKIFKALALALAGAMFMVACDETPAPYPKPGGGEDGKDTTVVTEKKITCAEAAELCGKLTDGAQSVETYVITGYITDVFANISNNQQSFWMADTKDGGKVIQAYWANLPEGVKKFNAGSKVAITGRLLKYVKTDGTVVAEVKNPTVVIMEQGGGDETGTEGTKVTCAKAVELCNALAAGESSAEAYSITGYITDVFANISNNQQSFWLADTKDGGKMIQAYWANLPEGVEAFTVGSKVTITGKLLKYVKTDGTVVAEVKNPTVVIKEQGGGDEPGTEATKVTCAKAVELCNALADNASSAETYAVTGYITDVFGEPSRNQQSFWIADTKDGGKVFNAFYANLPEGVEKFVVGSKVTITGKLLKYVKADGTVTPEMKNADVTIHEVGGGSTPGGEEKPGEGNTIVMSNAYSSCTEGSVEAGTITFGDATITFEKNDGNNAPMYYWNKKESLRSVRMYAKNSMEMTATKNIAKVVINCAAPYSGTNYNGNDQMTTTAGTISKSADKLSVTIDGINSKSFTLANEYTATTKGTQLRIVSMTITYVE